MSYIQSLLRCVSFSTWVIHLIFFHSVCLLSPPCSAVLSLIATLMSNLTSGQEKMIQMSDSDVD